MKWEFHYREDYGYLEVVISGPLSPDDLNKMAIERWNELRRLKCNKILFDFTQITNILSVIDIYKRPEESEKSGVLRTNRAAAVVPDTYWNEFKFMETVYQNRGFDLNVFNNKKDAINYLANVNSG